MANQNLGEFCRDKILTNLEQLKEGQIPDGRPSFQIGIEVRRYQKVNNKADVVYGFLLPKLVNPATSRKSLVNCLQESNFRKPTPGTGQFMKIERRNSDLELQLKHVCEDFQDLLALLRRFLHREILYECLGFVNLDLTTRHRATFFTLFKVTLVFARRNLVGGDLCSACLKTCQSTITLLCSSCNLPFHFDCVENSTTNSVSNFTCLCCIFPVARNEDQVQSYEKSSTSSTAIYDDSYFEPNTKLGKGFTIAHLNIRSLQNKIRKVTQLLSHHRIQILCLTETCVNSDVKIPNYKFVRIDRGAKDRGVGFYVASKCVDKYEKLDCKFSDNVNVEAIAIRVTLSLSDCTSTSTSKPFIVLNIYRNPSPSLTRARIKSFLDDFSRIINTFKKQADEIYVLGDFNVDFLTDTDYYVQCITNTATSLGLTQLISQPTRIDRTSRNLLDPVFVSRVDLCLNSGVLDCGISDHHLTFINKWEQNRKTPGCERR